MDHDGFRDNGTDGLIQWYDGRARTVYKTLGDFAKATGHEKHGRMVDYDIFRKAGPPLPGVTYEPAQYDLQLKPGAAAIDAGTVLPNVNDGFKGSAPDLGCHEAGASMPHYGPR
jgi:hypothetical protein